MELRPLKIIAATLKATFIERILIRPRLDSKFGQRRADEDSDPPVCVAAVAFEARQPMETSVADGSSETFASDLYIKCRVPARGRLQADAGIW